MDLDRIKTRNIAKTGYGITSKNSQKLHAQVDNIPLQGMSLVGSEVLNSARELTELDADAAYETCS